MYRWKWLHESKWIFGVSLVCILALFLLVHRGFVGGQSTSTVTYTDSHGQVHTERHTDTPALSIPTAAHFWLAFQFVPLSLVGWFLGGVGIGRDVGEGQASFLLTRPRPRASLVWAEWSMGMAELIVLTILVNLIFVQGVYLTFRVYRLPVSGRELAGFTGLICALSLLVSGLVYSVTYFATVLVKHSRGAIFAAAGFILYPLLGSIVHHYWPQIEFPAMVAPVLHVVRNNFAGFEPHWQVSMIARACVMLVLLFASQALMERGEFA